MKVIKDLDLYDYERYLYDTWYSYYFEDIECFLEGCYSSIEEDTLISILKSKEELDYILGFHPDISEYCMDKDIKYSSFSDILLEELHIYLDNHYNNDGCNIGLESIYSSIVNCVFIDKETNTLNCYLLDEELDLELEEKEQGYIDFVDEDYQIKEIIENIIQDKVEEMY